MGPALVFIRNMLPVLFLSLGCTIHILPEDQATEEERQKIEYVLDQIQSVLEKNNIDINIRTLPILVRHMKEAGACYRSRSRRGLHIEISKSAFRHASNGQEYAAYYPKLFQVLLHEIGHCYFQREHEDTILISHGNEIYWNEESSSNTREISTWFIEPSVMSNSDDYYFDATPKSTMEYYVKEIVGIERAHSMEELAQLTNGTIRQRR